MKLEFVCNMPGGGPQSALDEAVRDLAPGFPEDQRVFVDWRPSWRRVKGSNNYIGLPYGDNAIPGDVGIYHKHPKEAE